MIRKQYIIRFVISGEHLAALALLLVGLMLSTLVGCGGTTGRGPVSGTVTLDGRPLEHGVINFRPVEGNAAPGSGGVVIDGSFEIPADKGLRPGKYTVSIAAFKNTGRMVSDFPDGPQRPERVPVQIKKTDQLEATIGGGEENRLEFHLSTLPEG